MDTFHEFRAYWQLSEEMIADATKDDLAEVARILGMQAAHYARKYGELPIPDMTQLMANTTDEVTAGLLRDGTIALVGILGMVTGAGGVDIDVPVHQFACSETASDVPQQSAIKSLSRPEKHLVLSGRYRPHS